MLAANVILQSRYRIVRPLGQGGMGTVYESIDLRFDNQVALKETHFTDDALRKQFEQEARLLNKLRHPSIARVIDYFTEGGGQFLVMDYIAGEDLWETIRKMGSAFPIDKVLAWADQLLDALEYLHAQQPPVIHRDIKPQNLKRSDTGQIILLDFGLAKGGAEQVSRVTTSGSVWGYTPHYAPLEQIQGTGTDARSDLYSLAATLYHLITGVVPPDVITRVTATTDGQPDPLRLAHEINGEVPQSVAIVLNTALELGRTQRFPSACQMREALHDANHLLIASKTSFKKPAGGPTAARTTARTDFLQEIPPTVAGPNETLPTLVSSGVPRLLENSRVAASRVRNNRVWVIPIGAILAVLFLFYGIRTFVNRRLSQSTPVSEVNATRATNNPTSQSSSEKTEGSQSNSNQSDSVEAKAKVTIRIGPLYSKNGDGSETSYKGMNGVPVTILTSAGRWTKKASGGSKAYVSFDNVPCGEKISIIIADYPAKSEEAFYFMRSPQKRYIKCGVPVVDLGAFDSLYME